MKNGDQNGDKADRQWGRVEEAGAEEEGRRCERKREVESGE
jgi:hypothetical protein